MLQSAKPQHDELDAACKQFAQGDLILDPLTFYVARPDITASSWAREYEFVSGGKALTLGGVAPPPEPPFLIILDQTCDVHKASIPFIHAAPVYNATSAWNPKDLQKIKSRTAFHYLYALTAPRLEQYLNHAGANDPSTSSAEGDQLWVADLRIQIPLDKGVLVGRNGISAFADPAERLFFGDVLGDRRSRPAIPSVVQDYAAPILADACASIGDLVLGVEFRVKADSQINPSKLELVLLTPSDEVDRNLVTAALGPSLAQIESETGLPCTILSCGTADQVSAADYRVSVRFDPDELAGR